MEYNLKNIDNIIRFYKIFLFYIIIQFENKENSITMMIQLISIKIKS